MLTCSTCSPESEDGSDTGSLESTEKGDAQETVSTDGGTVDYSGMTIAWSPANLTNELQVSLTDTLKEELNKAAKVKLDLNARNGLSIKQQIYD